MDKALRVIRGLRQIGQCPQTSLDESPGLKTVPSEAVQNFPHSIRS